MNTYDDYKKEYYKEEYTCPKFLDKFEHYGIDVEFKIMQGDSFANYLFNKGIKFQELPILDERVIMYNENEIKKYALIIVMCNAEQYSEKVYITTQIPDDINWRNIAFDHINQEKGQEPMKLQSRFKTVSDYIYTHKIDNIIRLLGGETNNTNGKIKFEEDTDDILSKFPENKVYKTIYSFLQSYGYDVNYLKNANISDVDSTFIENILKYNQ